MHPINRHWSQRNRVSPAGQPYETGGWLNLGGAQTHSASKRAIAAAGGWRHLGPPGQGGPRLEDEIAKTRPDQQFRCLDYPPDVRLWGRNFQDYSLSRFARC